MEVKYGVLALVVLLVVVVAAFSLSPTALFGFNPEEEIVIGGVGIFSGEMAVYGDYMNKGVMLALDEINASGGINGKNIRVVFENDEGDPKKAVTVVEKLINVDKVNYVIHFSGSGSALAVLPVLEANKVPTVVGVASNSKIKYAGDYIFRIAPSDAFQSSQWAELALAKYKRPAILFVNNSWGAGLKETFIASYKKEVLVESMSEGASDVRSQLQKIKDYSPDVLFLSCYIDDCITSVKQMKELDLNVPVVAADVFVNPSVLNSTNGAAEGFIATKFADASGKKWELFKQKYISKYREEPGILHAMAYDMMYAMYYALKSSDLSRDGVKNALYSVNFAGPSGENKFDTFGEVNKVFDYVIVRGSKFVPYKAS